MLLSIEKRIEIVWIINDIYGNNLASGHCEVHPHVHEQYPCSLCYAESQQQRHYEYQQKQTDPDAEYYAKMERAHYEDIAKKNNWLYRVLCYVALKVNCFNDWLQKYKEKMLNRTMRKGYWA